MNWKNARWNNKIWYLNIYGNFVDNQIVFNSNKNYGYFAWRLLYIFDNISLNSYYNVKYLSQKF